MEKVKKKGPLEKEFENFHDWFAKKIDRVWIASCCLRAYSTLFHYELGILYKDWFGKLDTDISDDELESNEHLDSETKEAIIRVSSEPITLRPIGIYSAPQVSFEKKDEKEKKEWDFFTLVGNVVARVYDGEDLEKVLGDFKGTYNLTYENVTRIRERVDKLTKPRTPPDLQKFPPELTQEQLESLQVSYKKSRGATPDRTIREDKEPPFEDFVKAAIGRSLTDSEQKKITELFSPNS